MTRIRKDILLLPAGPSLAPAHPGRTIAAELAARGLSARAASMKMRLAPNRLGLIIAGRHAITTDFDRLVLSM